MTAPQGRAERRNDAAPSRRPGPTFALCRMAHLRHDQARCQPARLTPTVPPGQTAPAPGGAHDRVDP
jgi:hypothetical protein